MDCSGADKSELLAELINSAKPLGMGWRQAAHCPAHVTPDMAAAMLEKTIHFDYVHGRPIKVSFDAWPIVNNSLYDRDQGEGAFAAALARVRQAVAAADYPEHVPTPQDLRILQGVESMQVHSLEWNPQAASAMRSGGKAAFDGRSGKAASDIALSKFDKCWFTKEYAAELEKQGLPYPYDWSMYMGEENGRSAFVGSMGGQFTVDSNAKVILRHSAGF
jgi:hypothetical protein